MKYVAGSKKEDDNDENGPKRRVLHRLGPFSSSPLSFLLSAEYFVDYNLYIQ